MKRPVCWLVGLLVLALCVGCSGGSKTPAKVDQNPASSATEAANSESGGPENSSEQTGASTATASSDQAGDETAVPAVAGWRLVDTKYLVPDIDLDVNGGPVKSTQSGTGAVLLDSYQDSGETGNMILTHQRTGEGGNVFASVKWQILWSAPPATLPDGLPVSIDVEHKVLEAVTWDPPVLKAIFDQPDMLSGSSSSSANIFHQPNGSQGQYKDTREEVYNTKATMTTENPVAKGEAGDRMAIYINFGEGYGMRYTYEWR